VNAIRKRQQSAIDTIRDLAPGSSAWIWMTAQGPEGLPFLVVVPQSVDSSGETLVRRVRWIAKTCETLAAPVKGVLRRLASGALTLVTSGDLELAAWTLAVAQADAPGLEDVVLVRARGGSFVETRRVENLSAQSGAMRQILAGEKGWFLVTQAGGRTEVRLDTERGPIKSRAQAVLEETPDAVRVYGQLRYANGRVELRPSKSHDGLAEMIGQWSQKNRAWPDLRPLQTAHAQR